MAFNGYLTLDGNEIANVERFEAYAGDRSWFHPLYREDGLSYALGETYTDPVSDAAPWWDPDVASSGDFYGFYPVDFTGFNNSSFSVSTVESTRNGGVPGRVRLATREALVSGFIAGGSEAAVEYGLIWLRRTLLAGLCSPLDARRQALGTDLTYFGSKPPTAAAAALEGLSAQGVRDSLSRTNRRVTTSQDPQVLSQRRLACGDYMWEVQFTFRIGDPYVYSNTRRMFSSLFGSGGIDWGTAMTEGDTDATTFDEVVCGAPLWQPLYDPLCAAAITPPAPPNVPLGCWDPPAADSTHDRTVVTLPSANFPTFEEMMPVITLTSSGTLRDIRIRFYPDPDGDLDLDANPCEFSTDIVVSYMPAGSLVIDGSYEDAHFTTAAGAIRRADSLIFGSDQRPVDWPVLDCGVQYLMTIDTLGDDDPPVIDLDLIARTA